MQTDEANGLEDMVVTEMLEDLPIETVYTITRWILGRCCGKCESSASSNAVQLEFNRSQGR